MLGLFRISMVVSRPHWYSVAFGAMRVSGRHIGQTADRIESRAVDRRKETGGWHSSPHTKSMPRISRPWRFHHLKVQSVSAVDCHLLVSHIECIDEGGYTSYLFVSSIGKRPWIPLSNTSELSRVTSLAIQGANVYWSNRHPRMRSKARSP